MKTIVYNIKHNSDEDREFIDNKLSNHSHCLRFIYKKLEEITDKNIIIYAKDRWNLNDIEIRSIIAKAKQIRLSFLDKLSKTQNEITLINNQISELTNKNSILSKSDKKKLFNLKRKLAYKNKLINSDIVFGSKKMLKDISYLSNNKQTNGDLIASKKREYTDKRNGTIYLMGEANQKGNRFFDFDLINKVVIYKPKYGTKITLKLSNRKSKYDKQLQNAINNKQIAVTVSFNNDTFSISYDEAVLCGYGINTTERKNDIKQQTKNCISKQERDSIVKSIYIDYYDRLKNRQLENKVVNRYIGIDLNPEHIGYSIIDYNNDNNEVNIIKAGSFNFKSLTRKRNGFSSDDEYTTYLNNKRKYERKQVICELFKMMKHYKVAYFVMEDLEFNNNNDKIEYKEFNRKTKNIWDRGLLLNMIRIKCTEGGYQLIDVNPVYSSLIGNLSYKVFDPVAASLEIVRRGAVKYTSGGFYPKENELTIHTTEAVAKRNHIDVELLRNSSWKERYTILNSDVKFRYRWGEQEGIIGSSSLGSCKSRVLHNNYFI